MNVIDGIMTFMSQDLVSDVIIGLVVIFCAGTFIGCLIYAIKYTKNVMKK